MKRSKAPGLSKSSHEAPQLRQSAGAPAGLPRFLRGSAGATGLNNDQALGILRRSVVESAIGIGRSGDSHEQEAEKFASGGPHFAEAPGPATRSRPSKPAPGLPADSGRPLPSIIRNRAEPALHTDLEDVRVHDSPAARNTASQMGARAFTVGSDIWLGKGESERDGALMSHELAHVRQHALANGMPLMRDTIASALPPSVEAKSFGVSFTLPGNRALSEELSTTNPTVVSLTVSPTGLNLTLSPPLLIHAPFYASDMEWSSLHYDFATASVTGIGLEDTSILPSGQDEARGILRGKITALFSGTRVAVAGYDPLTDTDVMGTLGQIKTNFESLGSGSGGGITASEITSVSASVSLNIAPPIHQGTPDGAIDISGGVTITAKLSGGGESLAQNKPVVESISISGDSIFVQKDGASVAQIHDLSIASGGAVTLGRMTLLGKAKEAADTEQGIKGLGLLLLLGAGEPADRPYLENANPDLSATIVPGITRGLIQNALTQAVRGLIRQYANAIPGYDLNTVFGLTVPGDFPGGLPGETQSQRFG